LKSVDIVFGGDHGKRKFRASIKLIYRKEDGEHIGSTVLRVGHVDCEKDTYEVLRKTVGPPLNASLKRIIEGAKGQLSVFSAPPINGQTKLYDLFGDADVAGDNCVCTCSVRVFMTGDLAFYSTSLGKEHMSGSWDYICDLSHASWQSAGHAIGQDWTITKLNAHRKKIRLGELDIKKPNNVKRVKSKIIFDAVPLENWIVPILHVTIGIGSGIFKHCLDWVDVRIKFLHEDEVTAS
jgi:hypothetical protein